MALQQEVQVHHRLQCSNAIRQFCPVVHHVHVFCQNHETTNFLHHAPSFTFSCTNTSCVCSFLTCICPYSCTITKNVNLSFIPGQFRPIFTSTWRYYESSCLLAFVSSLIVCSLMLGPNISKTVGDRGSVPKDHHVRNGIWRIESNQIIWSRARWRHMTRVGGQRWACLTEVAVSACFFLVELRITNISSTAEIQPGLTG